MTGGAPTSAALAEALAPVLPGPAEITGLHRLSAGASRETWAFEAGSRVMILRRDPPSAPDPRAMAREAECFRAAARADVPIPVLLAAGDGRTGPGADIGSPFLLMERLEGEALPPGLLRDDRWAGVRPGLARQCGTILGRIHRIDRAETPALEHSRDRLSWLRDRHAAFGEERPAMELLFRWLEKHRPAPAPDVLVHGDFRNGNLLVDDSDEETGRRTRSSLPAAAAQRTRQAHWLTPRITASMLRSFSAVPGGRGSGLKWATSFRILRGSSILLIRVRHARVPGRRSTRSQPGTRPSRTGSTVGCTRSRATSATPTAGACG